MIIHKCVHHVYRSRQYFRPLVYRQISLSAVCMVEKLPSLMEFPIIGTPKLSHTLRNWFISKTLIRLLTQPTLVSHGNIYFSYTQTAKIDRMTT